MNAFTALSLFTSGPPWISGNPDFSRAAAIAVTAGGLKIDPLATAVALVVNLGLVFAATFIAASLISDVLLCPQSTYVCSALQTFLT